MEENREASLEREAATTRVTSKGVRSATSHFYPDSSSGHKPAAEAAAPQYNGLAIKPPAHDVQPTTAPTKTHKTHLPISDHRKKHPIRVQICGCVVKCATKISSPARNALDLIPILDLILEGPVDSRTKTCPGKKSARCHNHTPDQASKVKQSVSGLGCFAKKLTSKCVQKIDHPLKVLCPTVMLMKRRKEKTKKINK